MNKFSLLPSVNWNVSHMLVTNRTGTICAYGSRGDIVVLKNADKDCFNDITDRIISCAHKNARVMALTFVNFEIEGRSIELIASCGDDGRINLWDYETGSATHKTNLKLNPSTPFKFVDIDYFSRTRCIVCIAEHGAIVKWDLLQNKVWVYSVPVKNFLSCVAACPHADDLVAIGTRYGRVVVFSIKGEGKLIHRLLCHTGDVTSVAWCPVPYNVLQLGKDGENFNKEEFKKTDKTFLLASCCHDLTIYVSRAGTDSHCETLIKLPSKAIGNNSRFSAKRFHPQNNERGRMLKWIYPSVMVTSTNFNEIVSVHLLKFDNKTSLVEDKISSLSLRIMPMKYDIKVLHNIHTKNISSFSVVLYSENEIDFRVWSYSLERVIVRSGFRRTYKEKPVILPLISGFVFCMDISPANRDLLAIGSGDGKISVWNLSTDHSVDIRTLSKKIDHKVMTIRWHPFFEGVFAYGTYEGRIGLFNVSQGYSTPPSLFKLVYQKAVYRLCWAPAIYLDDTENRCDVDIQSEDLFLFASVDGDILQYNPKRMGDLPVSVTQAVLSKFDKKCDSCANNDKPCLCKIKSDMCHEIGRDVLIIGYRNGELRVFSSKSYKLLHVLPDQTKTIMSLTWHPKKVFDSPNDESPYCNWLAVAGEKVVVYEIKGEAAPTKVASLEVHKVRVLHVAWSPFVDGRLLTCSGDSTAIVWDAINQVILGRYVEHHAQVLCGIWSYTNRNVVITGSGDFTCRMWSVGANAVSTVPEAKKNVRCVEATTINVPKMNDQSDKIATSTKIMKNTTVFPSISRELHDSYLLNGVFEEAIYKHNPDASMKLIMDGGCKKHSGGSQNVSVASSDDSNVANGTMNENGRGDTALDRSLVGKRNAKKSHLACHYSDLFGSKEQLTNLIHQEESVLEENESNDAYVLVQARNELKTKITEAMEKNKITEYQLALAASVSPKLWKEACHVYIEQMIQANRIFEAVNFQLALGEDIEAVELLCEKRRFKEAFIIARLRLEDESTVRNVLDNWIHFCFNSGLFRLGAHCYMFLNEEEKASLLLSKSKLPEDAFLAAKLLKYYQPERAIELGVECVKRNLSSHNFQHIEEMYIEFPEIKFMEPWYLSLKYFVEESPNTSSITKWVIGFPQNQNSISFDNVIDNCEMIDYSKLQNSIVNNVFEMTYNELNLYISAQTALYFMKMKNVASQSDALRHYIRGLSLCYNYRLMNSNQMCSDKAYPLMKLLKLSFSKGTREDFQKLKEVAIGDPKLRKSVNAYFCEFVVSWLMACTDLQKSLKAVQTVGSDDGTCEIETNGHDLDLSEDQEQVDQCGSENVKIFDVIKNQTVKLEKMKELFDFFLEDVLDVDTVKYYKNTAILRKLDCTSASSESHAESNSKETKIESNEHVSLSEELYSDAPFDKVKSIKEEVDKFDKERVSAPNPFIFLCTTKDFLAKHKHIEPTIVSELENALVNLSKKCKLCDEQKLVPE